MNTQQDSVAVLLWLLWHRQGGSSPTGQSIRKMLGMGQHEAMTAEQVAEAKRIDAALQSQQVASADRGEAGMLPDALVPVSAEWYTLCERRFAVDRITISGELAEAIVAAVCATPPSPAESAAPSGVSDAMVKRAKQGADEYRAWLFENMQDGSDEELFRRALIAALGQPQPGRVEGMDDDEEPCSFCLQRGCNGECGGDQ